MASKTFPVGLTEEKRAEYQAAADEAGVSLAQWIRDSCDMRLQGVLAALPKPGEATVGEQARAIASDLRLFRGPDLKPSEKKSK